MAYDKKLAECLRALMEQEPGVSEMKMFGGLAFLINSNMAIAANSQGGLMVRVNPLQAEKLLLSTNAEPMIMRGRSMLGWLQVTAADVTEDGELKKWVDLSITYARSLPRKK